MFFYFHYPSPVGRITIASNETHVVGLWIEHQKYFMGILEGKVCRKQETAVIRLAAEWIARYFRGEQPQIAELPIAFIGSEFRKQVWQILARIPYGHLVTYGQIAEQIARQRGVKSMSAQAVGGAVGHNPISIIIPCHRVVGTNGNLTGYAGGIPVKRALLALEGAHCAR